jgi:multimeric flavodoxin WrbA
MKTLLLVYHSQSGATATMAQAVIAGARDEAVANIDVKVSEALTTSVEELRSAAGIILGTPENFGYMSGALKHFFDRIYYPCLEHTPGLPYALFIKASTDGHGAQTSIERIVTGLRWREIQPPIIVVGELKPTDLAACRELGLAFALGLEVGLF